MKEWFVYLEGKRLGTVIAEDEISASVAAEDEFDLTPDEGDDLKLVEKDF